MSRRRCCCKVCTYFSDGFDRSDSTSLGSNWTETAGDWSIASGVLSVSSANAKADCSATHPDSVTSQVITASFTLPATNDEARIWVNNSSHYVTLAKSATGGTVAIKTSGGTTVNSATYTGANFNAVSVCIDTNGTVTVTIDGLPRVSSTLTMTSSLVGLGTGTNSGTITFDDFKLEKQGDHTAGCPTCTPVTQCPNHCASGWANEQYQMTLTGVENDECSDCVDVFEGATLVDPDPGASITFCAWSYEEDVDFCVTGGTPAYVRIRWEVGITYAGGNHYIGAALYAYNSLGNKDTLAVWQKSGAGELDCLSIDDDLPKIQSTKADLFCDFSGVTCNVKSV